MSQLLKNRDVSLSFCPFVLLPLLQANFYFGSLKNNLYFCKLV